MCVVLVAKDAAGLRELVCDILGSAGHQCFTAANGLEAVAVFRSNRDRIDLVITELVLPVMGGLQAVARIRETKPSIPVIYMTAYCEDPLPPDAHILEKPFKPQELLNLITDMCSGAL
jgi:CheY-like chemotaxis protein